MEKTISTPLCFSTYVISNVAGGSLDPLGMQMSFSSLTAQMFPQFTILSNYPRYYQVLCAILSYLQKRAGERQFARIFREYENLWGIAQTIYTGENPEAVAPVNVTKYQPVIEEIGKTISFGSVNDNYPVLFQRLGYGTLGFYLAPSRKWGLVSQKKIPENTPLGKQLGDLLLNENKFVNLFKKWEENKKISISDELFRKFCKKTAINPEFSKVPGKEKKVWQKILENFIRTQSPSSFYSDLWKHLPPMDKLESISTDDVYNSFFSTLADQFSENEKITDLLLYCDKFEQFTAALEFLFELEYALIQNTEWFPEARLSDIKKDVFSHLRGTIQSLLKDATYLKRGLHAILNSFDQCSSWDKGFMVMTDRHTAVQERKGKRPFFDERRSLLQVNQVPFNRVKSAIEVFEKKGYNGIRYIYRRDWHFMRAARYKEFMS